MEINFTALASLLKLRTHDNSPFTVKGYSNSAGRVSDLVLRHCGRDGYLLLMQDSLRMLEHGLEDLLEKFPEADRPLVQSCADTLRGALRKRLAPTDETTPAERLPALPADKLADGIHRLPDDQGLVLTHLERLSEDVSEEGKISKPRDEASRIKRELEAMLPMATFIYRMDLKPGKFLDVQI